MKDDLGKMVRLPFSLLTTTAIIVIAGSYFYRVEIMAWLYPRELFETETQFAAKLSQSARVYGILIFSFLGSTTMYVFSTLLTANGNLKQLNLIALTGLVVNFVLNSILVPGMMASGAAVASLTTQLFTAGAYMLMAQYFFRFKFDMRFISTILLFALMVIGFNLISKELSFPWLLNFSIMLTASLIAAFVLRLINLREMYRLIMERSVS